MKISFDFDGTLDDDFDGTPNPLKYDIQNLAKKLISEGHEVCIITKRYSYENKEFGLGNESIKVYYMARELGIDKVYFTNRNMKYSHIINLGIEKHYENSDYEINLIKEVCEKVNYNCEVIDINKL